jgi:hypothetical protein
MTMHEPTPRPEVFDIFWRFTAERQAIFERRRVGSPAPWTSDRILGTYKFCNVFRAADRVSQYLIGDVAYGQENKDAADLAFEIVAFRTFSKIATWTDLIEQLGGHPKISHLRDGSFERALSTIRSRGDRIYTGAFILCATDAYGRGIKHLNHVELFKHMFLRENLAQRIAETPSLEALYKLIHEFPLMGDFMSYQTAIDLNYSTLVDFSENDFTQPGPGALRGIRKVFSDLGDYAPSDVIRWMADRQRLEFERRNLKFEGLWGRDLQSIDVQNLFCETDKYCREAVPSLASARTKIKSKFVASPAPIEYFFPPKWKLRVNELAELKLAG